MKSPRPLIIHPFLLAIIPILNLYSQNIKERQLNIITAPVLNMLFFTIVLLLLFRLMLKGYYKAGIMTSVFLLLFFSYGPVWSLIGGMQLGSFVVNQHRYLLCVWALLFAAPLYYAVKTKRILHRATKLLNIFTIAMLTVPMLKIVTHHTFEGEYSANDLSSIEGYQSPIASRATDTKPDIYYIILDRYASSRTLQEQYNFNNKEFIDYLSSIGFYIAAESNSNYLRTGHSLASSLNFDFINYLSKKMGEGSDDWNPLFQLIKQNRVVRLLKEHGYKYIHAGSFWGPTRKNESADVNISFLLSSRFVYLLYANTVLYPFLTKLDITKFKEFNRQQWESNLKTFDSLSEISSMKGPKFIFAHLLLPHPPFIFDRNGNFTNDDFVPPTDISQLADKELDLKRKYLEQLMFTNNKIIELVDKILSRPAEAPVIIIQADEGPWPVRYYFYKEQFNWYSQATDNELKQKTGILNAFFLPGKNAPDLLYPSITPVNTFRIIFNTYFNQHFQLLPDVTYAHVDDRHIYKLFSINDRINN